MSSARQLRGVLGVAALPALAAATAFAADGHSPEAERAAFEVADGFAINLFASESDGVAKPVQMRWDERGRLWVAISTTYPHVAPGARPDDKIVVLEDTDGDGRSDKSTVFADGLFMPTGLELVHDGALVANGTDLLLLRDTDGDGRADTREPLLSGFGTGDAHQRINSFMWGPGGELWFGQGAYVSSRVETPGGVAVLQSAGLWRLRPRTLQLDGFADGWRGHVAGNWAGPSNPWGYVADDWGQLFNMDASGHRGLSWIVPALVRTDAQVPLPTLWHGPKSSGMDIVGTAHLPPEMQGRLIIGSYFDTRVKQLELADSESGFSVRELAPLVRSRDSAFRPIDVKIGPDGAIYVCDWYNPVIGHYQASYRDPNRDKTHGRIWRITAKGRRLVAPPPLAGLGPAALLDQLRSPERWVRYQAKRLLFEMPTAEVVAAADAWVAALPARDPAIDHLRYEALGVFESHEAVRPRLLQALLAAKNARARAYATRVAGHWQDRLPEPLALLRHSATDGDARVRVEAVVASSGVPDWRAIEVAALVLDRAMDRWIEHALARTVAALKPWWQPALAAGKLGFAGNAAHLAYLVKADASPGTLAAARRLAGTRRLDHSARLGMAARLVDAGTPQDLRLVLDRFGDDPAILRDLAAAAAVRGVQPSGPLVAPVKKLLGHIDDGVRAAAVGLVPAWSLSSLAGDLRRLALDPRASVDTRRASILAIGRLAPSGARATLTALATTGDPWAVRLAAIDSLCHVACADAAAAAARMLAEAPGKDTVGTLILAFLHHKDGPEALAGALAGMTLTGQTRAHAREAISAAGRGDAVLMDVLTPAAADGWGTPIYSESLVRQIVRDATASGHADSGGRLLLTRLTSCTVCHTIGGQGGNLGPDLSSVGTGLTPELIVEAVLWPERQIKEGYFSVGVTMRDGETLQGYVVRESADELTLRDIARNEVRRLPRSQIVARVDAGTIMPPGLTAALSRAELRDLIRYLIDLGRQRRTTAL